MDFHALYLSLQQSLGAEIPKIFSAIAILITGWLLAVVCRAAVRKLLSLLRVNAHIAASTGTRMNAETPIAVGVFWLVLLGTFIAVLSTLDMPMLSAPFTVLMTDVTNYLPHLLAGSALSLVSWLFAMLLKIIASKALGATSLDERLSASAGMAPMSKNAGNVLFWVIILMFLPAILNAFQLNGLLEPVSHMVDTMLGIVPNAFAAIMIGGVGFIVARVLRGLVTGLLGAAGTERINKYIGMESSVRLSALAGNLTFIFVFIPSLIAALDALKVEAIARPATLMLSQILLAVPHIVAATVILLLTWYLARFGAKVLSSLLESAGVDNLPHKLGLKHALTGKGRPSQLAAWMVVFFSMLFAITEAADQLGFDTVRGYVGGFIKFSGDAILGSSIMVIGFWLSNRIYDTIVKADSTHNVALAGIARIAVLGLVLAMGLRAMGIANEIVLMAFGLTFGAVAVAIALSFGLGGREAAGKLMSHWVSKILKD